MPSILRFSHRISAHEIHVGQQSFPQAIHWIMIPVECPTKGTEGHCVRVFVMLAPSLDSDVNHFSDKSGFSDAIKRQNDRFLSTPPRCGGNKTSEHQTLNACFEGRFILCALK